MRYIAFLLLFLSVLSTSKAQTETSPKHEVRAVWLTTLNGLDWPRTRGAEAQKQELIHILDQLKEAGINTVLFQTRVRATTVYPSKMEPWEPTLAGGNAPSYNPLQFCIDECHKRGMECHAWVCTIPIGKWNKVGCKEMRKKYPKLIKRIGEEAYMDPANPQTADYMARICREIVANYDVDGIHLDYIRYPETWKLKISKSQARANITSVVRAIHRAVKAEKPWVKMSCSPIGKHDNLTRYKAGGWNARTAVCQDAQAWMREGLMDQLYPMMYFKDDNFYPFAIDWQEQSNGRTIVSGLGIYFLDPKEGKWTLDIVEREMYVTRQIGIGHCYFRSKFFTDNQKGIYDFGKRFDAVPALVPPMTWAGKPVPAAPTSLTIDGNTLYWQGAQDHSGGPYLLYNIYASKYFPVDINNSENIVATRIMASNLLVPSQGLNYAVTAMDRYGQESTPVQLQLVANSRPENGDSPSAPTSEGAIPFYTVSKTQGIFIMPPRPSNLDARFIMIENIQGKSISVQPYTQQLSLADIPRGIYQLRSLGRKGRNHRLGILYVDK